MGIASVIIGIFAVIGAGITTAPCMGVIGVPTALVALLGLGLAIAEYSRAGVRKARGQETDRENVDCARTGVVTNGLSLLWCAGCLAFKATM